jgi:hypothetical protein
MERILVVVGFLLLPIFSSTVDATVPASATPQSRAQLADGNGDTGLLRMVQFSMARSYRMFP